MAWGTVLALCAGADAAILCQQKKSGRVAVRASTCKAKETPVDLAQFIADGSVTSSKLADGAVTGSKLADGAVGDAAIADRPGSIVIPAEAIASNATVTRTNIGLSFPATFTAGASVLVPIPPDWDRQSTFTVKIYFTPESNAAGVVAFFLRPTGRMLGDALSDPGSLAGPGVNVASGSFLKLFVQTFDVPAGDVAAADDVFHLYGIQRGGTGETYADNVTLRAVEIDYTATR